MTTRARYSDHLRQKYGLLTFGRFLAAFRQSEDMTQVEFAKKLGFSSANLCDLEQGRRVPSPQRARQIAKKLGLPENGVIALSLEDHLRR